MTISYDGRRYFGWQRLTSKPTIQFEIEKAIETMFASYFPVRASGRTDRGAHASGQIISVELPDAFGVTEIQKQLNHLLPEDIRVRNVRPVSAAFHARDSSIGKRYRYLIWNGTSLPAKYDQRVWHARKFLDFEAMNNCCSVFTGKHDFASFATRPNFKQKTTIRTVTLLQMKRTKELIAIDICADGFLYKMVRNIVRGLSKAGEGRYSRADLLAILAARDRTAAPGTAPASGLYLEKVYYSEEDMKRDARDIGAAYA